MMLKVGFLVALAANVDGHNWVSSPSRANNGFNAYQTAPCPPKGGRVHVQVQAGQLFPYEFATGHSTPARGGTYLTVLKAEDERHMKKHTRAVLDEYIASAPPANPPYMAEHKSMHIGSKGGGSIDSSGADQLGMLSATYGFDDATRTNIRTYQHWANKPAKGSSIWKKTAAATSSDVRVQYKNEKYPWIIAVHKFKLHEDKSEESDLVMMEIPRGFAPGAYIIQYSWNGYYDCTDVNVITEFSTDWYGGPSGESYDKMDHCLWNPALDNYGVQGGCSVVRKGQSARTACFHLCGNGCQGIQVVPVTPPEGRTGLFQGRTKPYPAACNNMAAQAPADGLLCFPVRPGDSIVGSQYFISTDPDDSVFYGTCYKKGGAWQFAQASAVSAPIAPEDVFVYDGQCVDCNTMKRNQVSDIVPFWTLADECKHCDVSLGATRDLTKDTSAAATAVPVLVVSMLLALV